MNDTYDIIKDLPSRYESFVFSKWLRSLKNGNDFYKLVHNDSYYSNYSHYIRRILDHPDTLVRFAVLSEDHDVVLGFSVCQLHTLHYVYVQSEQRKQGIATALVPKDIDTISHLTKTGMIIWSNKYPTWKFNPFAGG